MATVRSAGVIISIGIAASACDSGTKQSMSKPASSSPPAIEAQLVGSCFVRYGCGMAHPGLGSYEDARSVDLAACKRTVTHDQEPDRPSGPPDPDGTPQGTHTSNTDAVPAERCAELAKMLGAITVADAAAAQEAAQVDTQACILDVSCPGGGPSKLRIQRQTTSGSTAVERLLRAL